LFEPRSAKQLEKDGGFHFEWIEDFLVMDSKGMKPGVVLILFQNDSKNTLQPLIEQYLQKETKWKIDSRIIIKDKNPRKNNLERTKHLQFTSAKQMLYVVTFKNVKVSFCFCNSQQFSYQDPK
jgi:hypothetical protein